MIIEFRIVCVSVGIQESAANWIKGGSIVQKKRLDSLAQNEYRTDRIFATMVEYSKSSRGLESYASLFKYRTVDSCHSVSVQPWARTSDESSVA